MNENQLVKEIEDFFTEVEWDDYKRNRIKFILKSFLQNKKEKVIVRHIYTDRTISADATAATKEDLERLARETCEKYSILLEQLKVNSPITFYPKNKQGKRTRKIQELVNAREDFVKSVMKEFPHTTTVMLGVFLGYRDHSSIIHLLRYRKNAEINDEGTIDA